MTSINSHHGKIFIGGISNDTTTESLRNSFQKFGDIIDCVILLDKTTNLSRGFGFVTFSNYCCAEEVLKMQPHVIDGKQVECKLAIPKSQMITIAQRQLYSEDKPLSNTKKIFVGGLHPFLKESELKDYFEQFGEVTQCAIKHDRASGKSRGFGFVIYAEERSVDKVMAQKNEHTIRGKWVDCKRAVPKDKLNGRGRRFKRGGLGREQVMMRDCRQMEDIANNKYSKTIADTSYASKERLEFIPQKYGQHNASDSRIPSRQLPAHVCWYYPNKWCRYNKVDSEMPYSISFSKYGRYNGNTYHSEQMTSTSSLSSSSSCDSFEDDSAMVNSPIQTVNYNYPELCLMDYSTDNFPVNYNYPVMPIMAHYFQYKLFDFNGESVSNLSSLSFYENVNRIKLFEDDESEKEKYSNKPQMSISAIINDLNCLNINTNHQAEDHENIDLGEEISNDNANGQREYVDYFGPHRTKLENKDTFFRPY